MIVATLTDNPLLLHKPGEKIAAALLDATTEDGQRHRATFWCTAAWRFMKLRAGDKIELNAEDLSG